MAFYTDRGRLPTADELEIHGCAPLQDEFGTLRRAFKIVLQASDRQDWDAISDRRH